jgi:hypothetical protein
VSTVGHADVSVGGVSVDGQFVSDAVTAVIAGALSKSCDSVGLDSDRQERCQNAMIEFSEGLGFRGYVDNNVASFVFFHDDFLAILNSDEGVEYLDALWAKTDEGVYGGQAFNLWDFTLGHFRGDVRKSVRYLAVLFQDDVIAQAQLKWLRVTGEADYSQLEAVMVNLQVLMDRGLVTLYPREVNSTRTAMYHFYVPWYMAQKLKFGIYGKDMAFFTPFLFNSLYEFRQMFEIAHPEEKVKYGTTAASRRSAMMKDLLVHLQGPIAAFVPETDPNNLEDMYIGYQGASLGVGAPVQPNSKARFVTEFPADPAQFMRTEIQKYARR